MSQSREGRMILRARVVVTMAGRPLENGAVAISGDQIVDVGRFKDLRARNSGEIVDLGERALLPGLINAHCHLDYTCLRGKVPRQKSFADWIRAINAEKAKLAPEDYVASINNGFTEVKRFGTTTAVNLTAFPQLVPQISSPIRTWWFGELINVRGTADADLAAKFLRSAEHWGLAPHAPFTASAGLYRRCERLASLLTTHIAESHEEMSMFRDASGPLYDFLKELGRDMSDCGGKTPLACFLTLGDSSTPRGVPKEWMVVHLNELTDSDFNLLEKSPRNFSIVHCPRSHSYFGHSPFQFGRLRSLGFNICLGTDSLASNDDLSLFAEMRAFQKEFPNV
ncbi:MAG TPA: amidohydrolase family protein, partial [Chthoniobacterales bacterium]|nr:amidohydrolase family protein [Chthoniobacterales bacterium]